MHRTVLYDDHKPQPVLSLASVHSAAHSSLVFAQGDAGVRWQVHVHNDKLTHTRTQRTSTNSVLHESTILYAQRLLQQRDKSVVVRARALSLSPFSLAALCGALRLRVFL